MASTLKPLTRTYIAGGAINPFSFVKYTTSSPATTKNPAIVQCSTNDSPIGISQNDSAAASLDEVEVAMLGGGGKLTLGAASGTVTPGQSLKSDSSGYGVPTTAAGDRAGAMAVEGGVANDIIGTHVNRFEKNNSDAT